MTFEVNVWNIIPGHACSQTYGWSWGPQPFFFHKKRIHQISAVQVARSHLPKREDIFQLLDKPVLFYLLHVKVK